MIQPQSLVDCRAYENSLALSVRISYRLNVAILEGVFS